MPMQDEVYVIPEEDFLEAARRSRPERRPSMAGVRPSPGLSAPFRAPIASSLSMFFSGAGQMYNGQAKLGALLILTEVLAIAAHWAAVRSWPVILKVGEVFSVSEWRIFQAAAAADFGLVVVIVLGVAQAYYEGAKQGARYPGSGSPIISGAASLMIPGWGQILNAQPGKATFFLLSALTEVYAILMIWLSPLARLLSEIGREDLLGGNAALMWMAVFSMTATTWMLSVYDAVLVAAWRGREG